MEINFFGGAGDRLQGELGGVQLLINDPDKKAKFFFDYGQPPDRFNSFYSFPYRPKQFELADVMEELGLYASIPGMLRLDLEYARGGKIQKLPVDGILLSHAHYDHAGGLSLIRHDMPIFMHPYAQLILYVWQYTSGRTINQFVDVVQQMSRAPKKYGKEKFISGEEGTLPRDIRLFESEQKFRIGGMDITPYIVDHSLPGSCAFIMDTSEGRIAISGDFRLRGRRGQETKKFLEDARDVDYFFMEGSLLHFNHYGTETDVTDVVEELVRGRSFVCISYPARDMDRTLSLYNATKKSGRILVVSPHQAKLLQAFNGANGYPKLSNKYIAVLLKPKGKGLIDSEEEFYDLVEGDYHKWEREYLDLERWSPGEPASKPKRVSLEDIANNQDNFILSVSLPDMISLFNTIKPKENSLFIRSHPAPWTKGMEVQEDELISILKHFGMYYGPQEDCLGKLYLNGSDLFLQGKPAVHKVHQVHVTGHMNRDETREALGRMSDNAIIVPYHAMNPMDFVNDVAKPKRVHIPERGKPCTLGQIRLNG